MEVIAGARQGAVQARGLRFAYLEWGDAAAPPMVLLHGLTGHARTWDHVASELAAELHIYVPDQRGHGDTQHAATYTTDDFAGDVESLREAWGLESFVLMGLSMGGHNALAYASRYPERVSRLIVVDIPPRLRRDMWAGEQAAEIERLAREGHRPFATFEDAFADARKGNTTAPDENLAYRTRLNLTETEHGLMLKWDPKVQALWAPEDLTDKLAGLSMPTLLVRGGKTNVLPERIAAQMVASLPDGELAEIVESGHSVPTDRPAQLVAAVREWLSRRSR